mmetsp:Transcript_76566/g.120906  ORF Transcript_76566/g.120906 Transcript_76566/m.120906 type:complete len:247 (+) Transcript_76566:478-1218(+)
MRGRRRFSVGNCPSFLIFFWFLGLWLTLTKLANDGVRGVLTDYIWRVDHVEFLCGILTSKCQNSKFTSGMLRQEAGDIENLTCNNYPTITLCRMLRNFVHRIAASTADIFFLIVVVIVVIVIVSTTACPQHANYSVGSILSDNIRRVNHVEFLGGVFTCEGQNRKLPTRVLRQKAGDVQNLVGHDYPTIAFSCMLRYFGHCQATASTTTLCFLFLLFCLRWSSCCWTFGFVHVVFIRSTRKLRSFH